MRKLILQAICNENHVDAVTELLSIPDSTDIIFSTAFLNASGLELIESAIAPVAKHLTVFAGIRNGITSAQGLQKAIDLGCRVMVVDTGTRLRIFHPKVFLVKAATSGKMIVGSANITNGGLNWNVEASIFLDLNMEDPDDAEFIDDTILKLTSLGDDFPENVFEIRDTGHIDELLLAGRIIDEGLISPPSPTGSSADRSLDTTPVMKLKTRRIATTRSIRRRDNGNVRPEVKAASGNVPAPGGLHLLWESGPLTRRDLSIPAAPGSNPTGSMLFKSGASGIDQISFFRTEVFDELTWRKNPRVNGVDLADADFQIIVRGTSYGTFSLTVSHDTRTNTKSFQQNQPMCALRWGDARAVIAKPDLIGGLLSLYRDAENTRSFVLTID